ncbi:MAG TPA: hypothetical protein VNG51_24235 [Ktedonobacteraceae bacterium]|nr:hypothetical protein [Ktedonobacteraceae bacterium]
MQHPWLREKFGRLRHQGRGNEAVEVGLPTGFVGEDVKEKRTRGAIAEQLPLWFSSPRLQKWHVTGYDRGLAATVA